VALVHDWLTGMRGGEYVLEAIAELFPDAELFTLIAFADKISAPLRRLPRRVSWLQRVPGVERRYRSLLPLMPGAIERFDLSSYELVLSSSHCVAKGVRKTRGSVHVSYVHAPMRYVWDRFDDYFGPGRSGVAVRFAARLLAPWLRRWDRAVSGPGRVDALVCNSGFIAERVREFYGREARVVHPFADLGRFTRPRRPGRDYLLVGAFAPYKRVDLAVEAFNRLKLPLLIVGSGQDEKRLRALAGPTVSFLGALSNEAIAELYSRCRAFVFPGLEDFGITPVEAMAAGAPVIAYGRGGAAETVTPETGILFSEQSVEALSEAVSRFEANPEAWSETACRERAARFGKLRFQRELGKRRESRKSPCFAACEESAFFSRGLMSFRGLLFSVPLALFSFFSKS
jgi:glycosyltransferase involved in cell wall biosynthesis